MTDADKQLIDEIRKEAKVKTFGAAYRLLIAAADRLEQLTEPSIADVKRIYDEESLDEQQAASLEAMHLANKSDPLPRGKRIVREVRTEHEPLDRWEER